MKEVERQLMVSIRCLVYNHEPYIRQCLDGFVMQKTNFRFEAIVHDDASTDGTATIIHEYVKKYPDIIKPIYEKENQYSKHDGSLKKVVDARMQGKYVALCEGDDYWIDPLKLQKEYDYLEAHPNKALVYTDCDVFFHKEKKRFYSVFHSGFLRNGNDYKDFVLNGNYLAPCSWLCRGKLYDISIPPFVTDSTLFISLYSFENDLIGYIDDVTCTYRIIHGSASHSNDIEKRYHYFKGVLETYKYYIEKTKDLFSEQELDSFFYKKYRHILPFALVLNDNEMIRVIKNVYLQKMDFKGKLMLVLSKYSFIRKMMYNILCYKISKGL